MDVIEQELNREGILSITLNRPEKLNSLSTEVLQTLSELFTHAKHNEK